MWYIAAVTIVVFIKYVSSGHYRVVTDCWSQWRPLVETLDYLTWLDREWVKTEVTSWLVLRYIYYTHLYCTLSCALPFDVCYKRVSECHPNVSEYHSVSVSVTVCQWVSQRVCECRSVSVSVTACQLVSQRVSECHNVSVSVTCVSMFVT